MRQQRRERRWRHPARPTASRISAGCGSPAAGGGGGRAYEVDERGNIVDTFPSRRCSPSQVKCSEYTNQSYDGEFTGRMNPNRPLYKPEHWDKVQQLDMNTNTEDPLFICQPLGLPRVGPPARIVQTANDVIFLYQGSGASSQPADYRIIPTDGRKHDPVRSQDVHFYGHSVGRWEGDTLVIDAIAFNDLTWLDRGGYFHSDQMRVTERLRRDGNILHYEVTVEDPEVLAGTLGDESAAAAAEPESQRLPPGRTALQRLRPREHGHADPALIMCGCDWRLVLVIRGGGLRGPSDVNMERGRE